MAPPVQFKVVDDNAGVLSPTTDANVSIVPRTDVGALEWPFEALRFTHSHQQNGFYRAVSGDPADEPGPGDWLLVVAKFGRSPVVQRLTLAEKNGVLQATAGWGVGAAGQLSATALTVSIVNYDQVPGTAPPGPAKQAMVTVRLLERLEMVSMGCVDKTGGGLGGTHFEEFAKGRTHLLFADKKLNDGVVFTLFTAMTRQKQTFVKSRAPSANEWVLVDEVVKAPLAKGGKQPVVGKDFSVVDFYQHLNNLGRATPGTVIEAGIFGHAYIKGPIVWNTFDGAASFSARDPGDFDGRNKDWVASGAIATSFTSVGAALHPTKGALRAWGCNHMNSTLAELRAGLRALQKKTPRDQFILVSLDQGGRENLTLDHLKRNVAQFIVSRKIKNTREHGDATGVVAYCGSAAQLLGLPCFGAPPGMGSNFGSRSGHLMMHIIADKGTENELPMQYYELEFGSSFVRDEHNYLNYNAMLAAPLPDPGYATARFIVYFDEGLGQQILRLPSGLELYRAKGGTYVDAAPLTLNGVTGHLYIAPLAKPDHVEDRDADRILILVSDANVDTGVFVGQDGVSILLKSPTGKHSFTMNTDLIGIFQMNFQGGNSWNFSVNPPTTVTQGVIQAVTPGWFW